MVLKEAVRVSIDCRGSIIGTEPLFYCGKSPMSVLTQPARNSGAAFDSDISTVPSAAIFQWIPESS
jgi:hypothetical protein